MSETVVMVVSVSVAGVVCIAFLIVVAICYRQWNKRQRSRMYLREQYRGIRSCSSTPTSPIAVSVSTSSSSPSCGFLFPKQENTDWNNIPVKSNRVREAKNANAASICLNSMNEYLEEPEVFELEPITRRKAATPPESPPMKVKRTQIVTFASSYNVSDGNGVVMQVKVPSPPPLPPKAKSLTYAELTFESETKVVVKKEEEEESEAVAPPLPPKPTVLLPEKAEKEKEESADQKKEKGENEMKVEEDEEEDEEDNKQEEEVEVEEEKEDEKEGEEKEEEVGQKVEGVSSAAVVSAVENGAVEHQKNGTTHEEHGTETEKDEEKEVEEQKEEVEEQDEEEAAKEERESDRSEETPSSCVVYERLVSEDHSVSSAGNGADPCSGGSSPNEVSTVALLPRSDSP